MVCLSWLSRLGRCTTSTPLLGFRKRRRKRSNNDRDGDVDMQSGTGMLLGRLIVASITVIYIYYGLCADRAEKPMRVSLCTARFREIEPTAGEWETIRTKEGREGKSLMGLLLSSEDES